MDKNNELLEQRISKDFENLEAVPPEDKADAVTNLAKLYELKLKADQQKAEAAENAAKRKADNVERVIKIVMFGVELVVPLAYGGYWLRQGFTFEEKGALCSSVFKGFTQKFKFFRK